MPSTKTFHLGDILSVTTSRLVSPRHIDGVYDILNWMTGDNLFTHQLPRASRECEGPLLAQHPDLASRGFECQTAMDTADDEWMILTDYDHWAGQR